MAGVLLARLPELELDDLIDPRRAEGQRWKLKALLSAVLCGLAAGSKSLAGVEALTAEMSRSLRRLLGVGGRTPDTTLRNLLEKLEPGQLRVLLHRQTKAAHRRKSLAPVGLPFGVVAMDGKSVTIESWDNEFAMRHRFEENMRAVGLVRMTTCALVSAAAKPCIDAIPIHATTNEVGQLRQSLDELVATYGSGKLFQLITYDAGGCSEENAKAIVSHGLDYLFGLKFSQPQIREKAEQMLGGRPRNKANAQTVDVLDNHTTVTRRVYLRERQPLFRWNHLRTWVRVESVKERNGRVVEREDRYFISSLAQERLTAAQWMKVVRAHWAVENNCHHTWDTAFEEDDHPWIVAHPRACAALMVLRRVAYNMLTNFRSVTQRSDERRAMPWKRLIRWAYNTLIGATETDLIELRSRRPLAAFS